MATIKETAAAIIEQGATEDLIRKELVRFFNEGVRFGEGLAIHTFAAWITSDTSNMDCSADELIERFLNAPKA